jgi:hypothetical protein
VQDFPGLEAQFTAARPADLSSRVSFQPHNFFTEQPVKEADVFVLKHILHDWSDPYATRIIRNLIPALQPGNRVMVVDGILPPRGVLPPMPERFLASLDLQMEVAARSHERSVEEWKHLFKSADERFEVKGVVLPPGCVFAVIEVVFG